MSQLHNKLLALQQRVKEAHEAEPLNTAAIAELQQFFEEHDLPKTCEFWSAKLDSATLSLGEIDQWENAIDIETTDPEIRRTEKLDMYRRIVAVYPTALLYHRLISVSKGDIHVIKEAYSKCKDDFSESQKLFESLLHRLIEGENWLAARALYDSRLRIPHRQLRETFEEFSGFMTAHFADEYTVVMRLASKQVNKLDSTLYYYEKLESKVSAFPDSPHPWIEYIEQVAEYGDKSSSWPPLLGVFYRSLFAGSSATPNRDSWIPVWIHTLYALSTCGKSELHSRLSWLFLHAYPSKPFPYSELLWTTTSDNFNKLRDYVLNLDGLKTGNSDFVALAKDLVTVAHALEKVSETHSISVANLLKICKAFSFDREILKLCLRCVTERTKVQNAKAVLFEILKSSPQSSKIFSSVLESLHDMKCFAECQSVVDSCSKKNLLAFDSPQLVIDTVLKYLRSTAHLGSLPYIHMNIRKFELYSENLTVSEEDADLVKNPEIFKEPHISSSQIFESPGASNSQKKRKIEEHEDSESNRNREHFRLKLSPISSQTSEHDIRQFFSGYGNPISVILVQEPEPFAVVELSSEQETLTCSTRHLKTLNGATVNITRMIGNTVWLANYPGRYGTAEIQHMILEATNKRPFSVRLPVQNVNSERRFCYVDFADANTAKHVRDILSGRKVENMTMIAEVSDPSARLHKESPPTQRQVILNNLNFKDTTEQSLYDAFSAFGTIEKINLPLNETNKAKHYINNGFAFITFTKESAAKDVKALGKLELDGRTISISEVKRKSALKKSPVFSDAKTVTLKNVDMTISIPRLKSFLEDKVGPVSQINLKPSQNMALVEFQSAKAAGSAKLILEGVDLENRKLEVNLKAEFFKELPTTAVPTMVPPMLMRKKKTTKLTK